MTCMLAQCPHTSAVCMGFGCQYYIASYNEYYTLPNKLSEFTDSQLPPSKDSGL